MSGKTSAIPASRRKTTHKDVKLYHFIFEATSVHPHFETFLKQTFHQSRTAKMTTVLLQRLDRTAVMRLKGTVNTHKGLYLRRYVGLSFQSNVSLKSSFACVGKYQSWKSRYDRHTAGLHCLQKMLCPNRLFTVHILRGNSPREMVSLFPRFITMFLVDMCFSCAT